MARHVWAVSDQPGGVSIAGYSVVTAVEVAGLLHVFVMCPAGNDTVPVDVGIDIQVRRQSNEPLPWLSLQEPPRGGGLATLTLEVPAEDDTILVVVVRWAGQIVARAKAARFPNGWFTYGDDRVGADSVAVVTTTEDVRSGAEPAVASSEQVPLEETAPANRDNPRYLARLAFATSIRDIWLRDPHTVIDIAATSPDRDTAAGVLMARFGIDERTANAVLDQSVYHLTRRSRDAQDRVIESMTDGLA